MRARQRRYRVIALALTVVLSLAGCSGRSGGADQSDDNRARPSGEVGGRAVNVVVVALEHPPVQAVLKDVDPLLAAYGDRVSVRRVDAESEKGQALAEDKGVTGHVALAIFVEGPAQRGADPDEARFVGFPRDRAPIPSAQGEWVLNDLRAALDQRVGPP